MQDSQQRQENGQDLGGGSSSGWRGQIRMRSQREGNGAGGTGWSASSRGLSPNHRPRNSGCQSPAQLPDLHPPLPLTLPNTNSTNSPQAWGAHIPSPITPQYSLAVPTLPRRCPHLSGSLGHRCLVALMGEQGWRAVLRKTSRPGTLPPGGHSPPRRGLGVRPSQDPRDGGADVQRQEPGPDSVGPALCPLALPNLPPRSTAPSRGRGGRPSLPGPPVGPPRA